jgi:hypothetical protein
LQGFCKWKLRLLQVTLHCVAWSADRQRTFCLHRAVKGIGHESCASHWLHSTRPCHTMQSVKNMINFVVTYARCLLPVFAALLLWLRITVLTILRQALQVFYGLPTSSPCCVIFGVPLSLVSTSMLSPEPTQSGDCSNRRRNGQQRAKTNSLAYLFLLSNAPFCCE